MMAHEGASQVPTVPGTAPDARGEAPDMSGAPVVPAAPNMATTPAAPAVPEGKHYQFFNHVACEFYPCHDMPAEKLNCLFCFCPLYCLGDACGGAFTYVGDVKDCSACTLPHRRENYAYIMRQFERVKAIATQGRE